MNNKDVIIVGAGIAGIAIAGMLLQQNKSFVVIYQDNDNTASKVSAALVNPYSAKGKKYNLQFDNFINYALPFYDYLEKLFSQKIIIPTSVLNWDTQPTKSHSSLTQQEFNIVQHCFKNDVNNFSSLSPIWKIYNQKLLHLFQAYLQSHDWVCKETFRYDALNIFPDKITYKQYSAKAIIFCEGVQGKNNPYFTDLPFTQNRGDVLLLSIPKLSQDYVYDFGIKLVPIGDGTFWCGSNHQWQYDNLLPDIEWRKNTENILYHSLKIPFSIVRHIVAERPTTAGQKIIAQLHTEYKSLGILNGLGTKGFAAAPFYANRLLQSMQLIQ